MSDTTDDANTPVPPAKTLTEMNPAELAPYLAELDLSDSQSVLFFGSKAKEQLTTVSDSMLERVRSKDVGPAGDALKEMVLTFCGFAPRPEAGRSGWLSKLMGGAATPPPCCSATTKSRPRSTTSPTTSSGTRPS